MNLDNFLERLKKVKQSGSGNSWVACCPAHEDRKPSLSISEGSDGTILLKCHAGCKTTAIVKALGITEKDLFPPKTSGATRSKPKASRKSFSSRGDAVAELERQYGECSALWTYHDDSGMEVGAVVRWDQPEGKDIRPVALHPNGWQIGAMPEPRPLYRLPELAKAERVIVVEGEKAAEAAHGIGFVATTSVGGSQASAKSDWSTLAGKEVWILPDNDSPGRKYAEEVISSLARLTPACVVKLIELPGLPEKGDIVEWIEAHGDAAEPEGMREEIVTLASKILPEAATNDSVEFKPFPVDALPEPLRGFVVAGAKAIGCDSSYLALPLLVLLAAAIGMTRRLELKRGWSAPAIIWGAIVGESGTAKTPAFSLVMRPIRQRQRKALERHAEAMEQFEVELARWEKEYAAWKRGKADDDPPAKPEPPACERFIVMDTTVEALAPILLVNPRGLLLARDELAGWIGSFDRYAGKGQGGSADSANWLSMFNAESMIVDRKTGIPKTIHVPQAAVCVTGGIQPGILHRALGDEHRESGLAARLLLTCPPRKEKRWTEADIDPKSEEELARLLDRLFDLQPTQNDEGETRPELVRLTPKAKAVWKDYFNAHAVEQADLSGDLSAAWSKLEEYAARLALVIHYARWAAKEIHEELVLDVDSMKAGIALATWFKGEARRVYAMLGESEADRDERRLIEWIARKGGSVTARETRQGCRWLRDPGLAESALESLVRSGRGSWQVTPTTPKGGQPARRFVLSTPSTVYTTFEFPAKNASSVDVDTVDGLEEHYEKRPSAFLFPESDGLPD